MFAVKLAHFFIVYCSEENRVGLKGFSWKPRVLWSSILICYWKKSAIKSLMTLSLCSKGLEQSLDIFGCVRKSFEIIGNCREMAETPWYTITVIIWTFWSSFCLIVEKNLLSVSKCPKLNCFTLKDKTSVKCQVLSRYPWIQILLALCVPSLLSNGILRILLTRGLTDKRRVLYNYRYTRVRCRGTKREHSFRWYSQDQKKEKLLLKKISGQRVSKF